MTEQPARRGGWPGPAKPKWSFRPTEWTEVIVAGYIKAHSLNPDRDKSRATNALIALAAKHAPIEAGRWQMRSVAFLADGDIYGDALHRWRIRLSETTEACAYRLLSERRPAWPTIIHAPNGLPLFVRETNEPCDCATMGVPMSGKLPPRLHRCEAEARKGTGTGVCDAPLDKHGNCPNVGDHL
jgi:hypothetical protein